MPFNPFPGLRPFDRGENDRFFGREEHVDELLRRLRGHRFVAVIGASGSGKSSLVRAGLLPALEGGFMVRAGSDWRIAVLRPGTDPFGALAAAVTGAAGPGDEDGSEEGELDPLDAMDRELERDMAAATLRRSRHGLVQLVREARWPAGENLLVVVDQFEELFRFRDRLLDRTSDEGAAFVRLLLTAAEEDDPPVYVVLTMRSDFLGDCAWIPGLPEAINRSQYLVPRLTRRQLEATIRGPIGVGGARIEGPLLQRLLNDVSDDPDQLPILQHALMRTFDRWLEEGGKGAIGLSQYRAIGGMEEALSRHADEAYGELPERLRPVAESVFKSLTERGESGRGVRRPTRLAELAAIAGASEADARAVVDVFRAAGRTFLTPSPEYRPELAADQVIDISHESLMRVWSTLVRWVEEEAEAARFYHRLAETAVLYPEEAGLWRNPELEIAARWRSENRPTAAWAERYGGGFETSIEFLEASEAAWREERRAEEARHRAESSKRLAFQSERTLPKDHELALLLAIAAGRASPTDEAERALRRVLDHRGRSFALLEGHRDRVIDAAYAVTPEGHRLASASLDGAVVIWDAESFERRHELAGHRTAVRLAWSGDGRRLATAGIDGTAGVWDPATGERLHRLTGHEAGIADAAWHADGRRLATASFDRTVRLWDAESGEELAVLRGHEDWVWRVAWHGDRLATAGGDGTVRLFEVPEGAEWAEARVLTGHVDKVRDVAWSPGGELLASAGSDGTVRVWDAATGEPRHRFEGHRDWVVRVAWAADGTRLASASRDGTARLWSVGAADGDGAGPRAVLAGHEGEVHAVAWSEPPERLLTAGADGTVRVWTPGEEGEVAPSAVLTGHRGPVQVARFAGRRAKAPAVISGGFDGTVRFWDPGPGYQRIPRTEPDVMPLPWDARWSPDGERIATGHQDGSARLWSVRTGQELAKLSLPPAAAAGGRGRTGPVVEVAWSPDGTRLLTVSRDHRAVCWDPESGEATVFEGHRTGIQHGAWSPDGDRIVTGSVDGVLHLWRPGSPGESARGAGHGGGVNAIAWHPDRDRDGRRLLSAGDDGTLVIWEAGQGGPPALRRLHALEGHLSAILHALWSPDGRRVASVGADQTVRLWDAETGRLERTLVGHRSWTLQVAWSPDGRQLASAGRDGLVRLWDLSGCGEGDGSDTPSLALEGHRSAVRRLSFSPEGDRLVTSGQDREVRLWRVAADDPRRGDEIVVLARHDGGTIQVSWSPEGDRLLTTSLDGTLRVYLARLDDLVAEAKRRAVRGPRPEERELYGLEAPGPGESPAPAEPEEPSGAPETAGRASAWAPGRPVRIGAIVFAENEWAQELHRGLLLGRESARDELGVEVELEIEHHQFSLSREIALIDRFLDAGVDALVISPRDLEASVPKIREAHERGVAVICVGTSINLRDAARYVEAIYESDQFELGYRTGYYLAQWLVDRGLGGDTLALGIVQCERFEQCYQRGRGFRAALLYAGVKWREVSNVEGLVIDQAERRAEAMLREHPEILVVFTQHDESTRGAVEAVRRLGLAGKVFVFGTDIADSIAQMLAASDDVLQATTAQQARRMGCDGVLDAVRSVLGRDIGPRHKVLASPLYTREPWHAEALKTWNRGGETG